MARRTSSHPVADARRHRLRHRPRQRGAVPADHAARTSSAPGPGLRPLLQPGTKAGHVSRPRCRREHTVASPTPGLTVIAGGKLTTYRVMAKDAVDFAIGSRAASAAVHHRTTIPLAGRRGAAGRCSARRRTIAPAVRLDARRCSTTCCTGTARLLAELVELVDADPSAGPAARSTPPPTCGAEIAYAVSHEGALHLDDVLMHRTRLDYEQADRGLGAIEEIADLVAPAARLGRDDAQPRRSRRTRARRRGRGRRRAGARRRRPRRSGCAPPTCRRCSRRCASVTPAPSWDRPGREPATVRTRGHLSRRGHPVRT